MSQSNAAPARKHILIVAGVVLTFFVAFVMMSVPLAAATHKVSTNYNEGWNAYWADAATHGRPLYATKQSTVLNNYPPVSFYLVGAFGTLVGDNIYAGRIIAALSLLLVAGNVFFWLRITGSSRTIGFAGAAMFLAEFAILAPGYIAANDPQLLAHAIMLTGLSVLWRAPLERRQIVIASVLMILAGFTKHLLISLPIAVTLWYLLRSRAALWTWLAASLGGLLVACIVVWLAYGSLFLDSIAAGREYMLHRAVWASRFALARLWPVLLLSVACGVRAWRFLGSPVGTAPQTHREEFALLYLIVAGCIGVAASGGLGVSQNAFFDLLIAASLCAALGLESLQAMAWPKSISIAAAVALLLGSAWAIRAAVAIPESLRPIREQELRTAGQFRLLARLGHDRRVACESLALCYWAHLPFELDMFNYGQKLKTGAVPEASCEALLVTGPITVVQLEPLEVRALAQSRLPSNCNAAIRRQYQLADAADFSEVLMR